MDVDMAEALERLNDRIDRLETTLRGEIAGMRGDLRGEFRASLAENRRRASTEFVPSASGCASAARRRPHPSSSATRP